MSRRERIDEGKEDTLTADREKRVEEAIGRAEGVTSGEIVPMVVDQSDAYLHADFIGALIVQFAAFLAATPLLPTSTTFRFSRYRCWAWSWGFSRSATWPP